ncbi:MAG: metal-dependent transcriptional regulator [Dehalococcoidia bacterium]
MARVAKPTSIVAEDYLTTIFRFAEEGRQAISVRLSEALSVSPATAFGMLKRMNRDGLVQFSQSKEIALTTAGKEIAEDVIRRHRLAERLLTDVLHLEWHKAYAEAHRLEHGISPDVADRLEEILGNPNTCPHGYPIPRTDGYSTIRHLRSHLKSLKQVPQGVEVVVQRVPEEDAELLKYLDSYDVRPGAFMMVTEVAAFKGTITLQVNSHEIVISSDTAAKIVVKAK